MASQSWSFYKTLKLNGTGASSMVGAYSPASPGDFWVECEASKGPLTLARILIFIEDGRGFAAENYGSDATPLTNGIDMYIADSSGNALMSFFDGLLVKSNSQWARICYDAVISDYGVGNESFGVRFTFGKSGSPVVLESGERVVMRIQDDLTGLISHHASVQGFYPEQVPKAYRRYLGIGSE